MCNDLSSQMIDISTHDLTRRSTVDAQNWYCSRLYFNSRPHEEVDALCYSTCSKRFYFNSRPHEEVDVLSWTSVASS